MANVTVIPEEYDALKKEYLVLRKELDCVKQELHGCKRQLKVLEALQQEYQSEIEILQSEEHIEKQKYEEKIAQLEEAISNARIKCNERVQAIEVDLSRKEEENNALQAELDLLKKVNSTQSTGEDNSNLFEEVVTLRQEKEVLIESEDELKSHLEILQKNYLSLEELLTEHREELSVLKKNLGCKRDELFEANDLIQKLNDEVFCLKNELESYKSKPLNEQSKGNSLFAEVDDRRVYLQKTINSMKSEYISMKQERAKNLNLISHLRRENKTLCDRWKADVEEKEDDENMILKAYKDRVCIYENLIDKYKRDLSGKPLVISTGSFTEIEFYQAMVNNKVKEIEELRDQISARGSTQVMLSMSLKEANKEIRKWRLEAKLRECQLDLKSGDLLTESKVKEKVNEVMDNQRLEPRQVKTGPNLACKKNDEVIEVKSEEKVVDLREVNEPKEVITITDSSVSDIEDNVCVKKEFTMLEEDKENLAPVKLETQTGQIGKAEVKNEPDSDVTSKIEGEIPDEKDNVSSKTSRKVTFSQNTTSPKITDRTAMRRNCKRMEVPKPIYISSE